MKKLSFLGKKFLLALLLTVTMLFGGTKSLAKPAEKDIKKTPVTRDISFTFNKAAETYRFAHMPADSLRYPDRNAEDSPKFYTFTKQLHDQVDSSFITLWQNMQTLKTSQTIIGPALAKFSEEADLRYCYARMPSLLGFWHGTQGVVYVENFTYRLSPELQLIVQAHETLHALQQYNNLGMAPVNRTIYEFQLMQLSKEAAGWVSEYLVALELRERGMDEYWKCVASFDKTRAAEILTTWDNLRAAGVPYAAALEQTGKVAFYKQFERKEWLEKYNDGFLLNYLRAIDAGLLEPISGQKIGLNEISKMGYISPEFNFTAGIDSLPSLGMGIFGGNARMAYAFDCAELWRIKMTEGMESATYKDLYARMKELDNNPYVELDMRAVLDVCGNNKLYPLAAMEKIIKKASKVAPQQKNELTPK